MSLILKKVLISDDINPQCAEIMVKNGIEVAQKTKLTKEQLIADIPEYDGLIVRSATKVTADVVNAATNLKIVGRAGTGVDNIDIDACTKQGVIVMNTPGGNTMSAAEHTCAMVTAISRHLSEGTAILRAGKWDRKTFMGTEVFGKTIAIIGLGRIGKEVATRMQAFGMTTIGYDPIIPKEVAAEFDVEWMPLEDIWTKADYITVHVPLIPPTKHMINDEVLKKCKKGVRLINCARGGIIDEAALVRALESGQCAAAGLDVFEEEPPTDLTLINHPRVTSTPHWGALTKEAQLRVGREIAEQFVDVVQGKSLFGAINAAAMSNALSVDTKPWVMLGERMGKVLSAMAGHPKKDIQVSVTTQSSALKQAGSYLAAAALVGLLQTESQNSLNLVSAPALAKEVGIKVSSSHVSSEESVVTICLKLPNNAECTIGGTVICNQPAILSVNHTPLSEPVKIQGDLLLYSCQRNSNVLCQLVGAINEAGSQVASFSTTCSSDNDSWCFMRISPPGHVVDAVKRHVIFAEQISF